MLTPKPYSKNVFLYLILVFALYSCQKQTNPVPSPPPSNPPAEFVKFERFDNNHVRLHWSGLAGGPVKYNISLNGNVVAANLSDTTFVLDYILATLSYSGKLTTSNGGDIASFEIPAETGFIYTMQDIAKDGIGCFSTNGNFVWKQKIGECAQPAIANDTLFVQSHVGINYLYALNAKTGKIIWSLPEENPYSNQISTIYDKGVIYVVSEYDVYARRSLNGAVLWHVKRDTWDKPSVGNGVLLCSGYDVDERAGFTKVYDLKTGQQKWDYKLTGSVMGFATEKDHIVYLVDSHLAGDWWNSTPVFTLNAIDANTGVKKWSTPDENGQIGTVDYQSRPYVIETSVFVSIHNANGIDYVYAFNKDSGQFLWKTQVNHGALAGGKAAGLFVFGTLSTISKLDLQTGKVLWTKQGEPLSILIPGKIYSHQYGTYYDRTFKLLDPETGKEDLTSLPNLRTIGDFTMVVNGVTHYITSSSMYKEGN